MLKLKKSKILKVFLKNMNLHCNNQKLKPMKTLIILNNTLAGISEFAIVEGDFSKFHNIKIGNSDKSDVEKECYNFLFNNTDIDFDDDISIAENKHWSKIAIITLF